MARRLLPTLLGALLLAGAGCAAGPDDQATTPPGSRPDAARSTTTLPPTSTTVVPTTTTAPDTARRPITLAFAGDLHFEGSLRTRLDRDPATAVGPFAEVLRSADLAVGNLETAIATGGTRVDKEYAFRAPPIAIDALRAAGFDAVSLANNHGIDFGPDGLAETLAVQRAQPDHFLIGIGSDEDSAYAPFRAEVGGWRVAVVAATQVLDDELIATWTATPTQAGLASAKRVDRLLAEVERATADSDLVVVFLHWGVESTTCPSAAQQSLARRLVDAGADVVVGGHAHRLQGAGRLGDAVVGYGLGNFLFHAGSPAAAATGVLRVTATPDRPLAYEWVPGRISGGVPAPLTGIEADQAQQAWQALRTCTALTP